MYVFDKFANIGDNVYIAMFRK